MITHEESPKTKKFDLEERLINYSVLVTEIVEAIPNTRAGIILQDNLYAQAHPGTELCRSSER